MNTNGSIEIEAPAASVWDVFVDVERWSEWTASITRIVALDGPGIEVGRRFEIKQPGMPNLVWQVTEVDPGHSWIWRQRSVAATTFASHTVTPQGTDRTLVQQDIDQRGPLGVVVGALMRRRTRRFLDLEARGLKVRSEQSQRDASTA
jgi:uncharacterized protein YndB with AHSA1/START domain